MGMSTKLLRVQAVVDRVGFQRALLYRMIADGLFTRPVKITARASAWPETEVTAVINAKIRGATDDELKRLVRQLHAARAEAGLEAA